MAVAFQIARRADQNIVMRVGRERVRCNEINKLPEADPAHGRRVVRAEPMSTLDAELNDFGAQLAMLRGHAADRDG
jgi:hypothetical protein